MSYLWAKGTKMIKLAFIKDPHLRMGMAHPQGRTEDFENNIKNKLGFIKSKCSEQGVSALFFTGDLLDKKTPSDYSFSQICQNEDEIKKLSEEMDVYSIFGNHDLPYSSQSFKDQSILKYFMNHDIIKPLPMMSENNIAVYGIDYIHSIEDTIAEMEKIHNLMSPDKYNIIIVHHHFVPQMCQDDELKYSSFKRYSALHHLDKIDAFVFGHLHMGYQPEMIFNPTSGRKQHFINPWSLTRLSRSYYSVNDKHKPQLVILSIDDNMDSSVEVIEIPHLSFAEAFISEEMTLIEEFNENLHNFMINLTVGQDDGILVPPEKLKDLVEYYLALASDQK